MIGADYENMYMFSCRVMDPDDFFRQPYFGQMW